MSLLKPKNEHHQKQKRAIVSIPTDIYDECKEYCGWIRENSFNHFFVESLSYILTHDKSWQAEKKQRAISPVPTAPTAPAPVPTAPTAPAPTAPTAPAQKFDRATLDSQSAEFIN